VRLRGLGEEESVEAEIRNLSALGMFVASKRVPQPGAAVFCRVLIGNDRRIIKGKVAWASPGNPDEPMGAGIEFIDLSNKDCEVLRHVVQTNVADAPAPEIRAGMNSDQLGRVEVIFEGLPAPVNARARVTPEGIVLTTKLPFLRVGSHVKIRHLGAAEAGRPGAHEGQLQAVSLGSTGEDGVPRLLVELNVAAGDVSLEPLTEGSVLTTAASPPPHARAIEDTDPQPFTLPMPGSPFNVALVPDGPRNDLALQGGPHDLSDPDVTPVSSALALMSQLSAEIDLSHPARRGEEQARSRPPSAMPVAQSIDLHLTPLPAVLTPLLTQASVSEPTTRVERLLDHAPPLQSSHGKMVMGAAMVVVAVVFFIARSNEPPSALRRPQSPKPTEAPPQATGIRIAPLPPPRKMAPGVKAPPAGVEAQKPEVAWRPISDPTWPFTLVAEGAATTIFIPLQGDQSESRVYAISGPNGVVAQIPHGRIRGAVGKYSVNQAGVTQVWVEERETGLHARVVFGRNVQSHQALLEPTGLRVVAKLRAE
jgi:hypothetical protein